MSIDLGATNLRVGIVSQDLKIIHLVKERTIKNDADALLAQICRLISSLPYQDYDIKYVGISACGLIDHDVITLLSNLNIRNFDLKKALEKHFPFQVFIKNDANCTGLAEATFGASNDVATSYFMTISSGIGGVLIYEHQMIDLPFEIGHIKFPYHDQMVEFEHLCSGNGMVNLAHDCHLEINQASELFALVKENNSKAKQILSLWEDYVALVISNLQLSYNTDKFVLSGGVMKSSDLFISDLTLKANQMIKGYPLKPINIVLAKMDQDAGLFGGVAVALAAMNNQ
jgi:glucokinase